MTPLRCVVLLALEPKVLIQSLHEQVVAHHPVDIPFGVNMRIFAPTSNALLHKLDLDDACIEDWNRQYPDPDLKPPIYEVGSSPVMTSEPHPAVSKSKEPN